MTAKTYDYRPFGDSLAATGELPNQGFANMEQDEESEYIQMGARTYNPALGRFMSVDPLFEAFPGQSAYSYAFNSPLSWSDPSGLTPEKEKKRDRVLGDMLRLDLIESETHFLYTRNVNIESSQIFGTWDLQWYIDNMNWFAASGIARNNFFNNTGNFKITGGGKSNGSGVPWNGVKQSLTPEKTVLNNKKMKYPGLKEIERQNNNNFWSDLNYEIPIWGNCARSTDYIYSGDYGIAALYYALAFVDGFSFGLSYLEMKAPGTIANIYTRFISKLFGNSTAAKGVTNAYEIALTGGKHSGWLNTMSKLPSFKLQKIITSMEANILEHQNLINSPAKYMELYGKGNWNMLDPRQQQHLLNIKWPGDIHRAQEQINILQGIIKSR